MGDIGDKTLTVNLCSGGLDSYLAWKLFAPYSSNVYVRIGHRYEARELGALARLRISDHQFSYSELQGPFLGPLETSRRSSAGRWPPR